jgi:hypothetical protein
MFQNQYAGYNIIGTSVKSAIEGLGVFRMQTLKILKENEIVNLQDDKWYPYYSSIIPLAN